MREKGFELGAGEADILRWLICGFAIGSGEDDRWDALASKKIVRV